MHKKDLLTAVSEVCEKYFLRILKLSKKKRWVPKCTRRFGWSLVRLSHFVVL